MHRTQHPNPCDVPLAVLPSRPPRAPPLRRRTPGIDRSFALLAISVLLAFFGASNWRAWELPPSGSTSITARHAFTPEALERLHARAPHARRAAAGAKVVYALVDGLRWLDVDPAGDGLMADFARSPAFAADGRAARIEAELPSHSLPNYVAQITGAPPELTGVYGNSNEEPSVLARVFNVPMDPNRFGKPAPPFETVFDRAGELEPPVRAAAVVPSGYGFPGAFWAEAAAHSLRNGTARGRTLPAAEVPEPETYEDAAGAARAVGRQLDAGCGIVVVYFRAVDTQSHKGPLDRAAYAEAVRGAGELAAALHGKVSEYGGDAVLLLTSDHGGLDLGGHGGVERHCVDSPAAAFRRGSGAGARADLVAAAGAAARQPRGVDVASTIAALAGVPVPRQNTGVPIPSALSVAVPGFDRPSFFHELRGQLEGVVQELFGVRLAGAGRADDDHANADAAERSALEVASVYERLRAARVADSDWQTAAAALAAAAAAAALFSRCEQGAQPRSWGVAAAAGVAVAAYCALVVGPYYAFFTLVYRVDEEFVVNASQLETTHNSKLAGALALVGFVAGVPALLLAEGAARYAWGSAAAGAFRGYAAAWTVLFTGVTGAMMAHRRVDDGRAVRWIERDAWAVTFMAEQVFLAALPLVATVVALLLLGLARGGGTGKLARS